VINNDTYDEMPLVFNRLAPVVLAKNKVKTNFDEKNKSIDVHLLFSLAIHFLPKEFLLINHCQLVVFVYVY